MTDLITQTDDAQAKPTAVSMMLNTAMLANLMEFAKTMASSTLTVPKHLQGKPADCMAIAMQAAQWGMNPFAVAQKTHLVNGTLGYEAQLVNAVIQNSGAIVGSFHYEYQGSGANISCRVGAVLRGDSELTWGQWLSAADVTTKNSPLWKTNVRQQLGYLQVKNWGRAYAPGAILGVYSDDELADAAPAHEPRVVHMGVAEQVQPQAQATHTVEALPPYDDAKLEANLANWDGLISSGRKTAQQVIDSLATKVTLTDAQVQRIRALEVVDDIPDERAPDSDLPF